MKTKILPASDPQALRHASDILQRHGVVAFPTDTVYGLGAGAFDEAGVDRLYSVKGRDQTKAIAILLADLEQLYRVLAEPSTDMLQFARAFWPGPLTLVLRRHPSIPDIVSPDSTLGVRIPDHPVARALLRFVGPLATTSANLSGGENATTAEGVLAQLDGRIDLLLDGGQSPGGQPSTVLDLSGAAPKIVREGPIRLSQIKQALQAAGISSNL